MNAEELARELKELTEQEKAKGISAIPCDSLIAYLNDVLKDPLVSVSSVEMEKYKAQWQLEIEMHKSEEASNLEMFKSVITSGQYALRAGFLLNGGAVVVLLGFISHLATTQPTRVAVFANSLMPLVTGVFLNALASGTTYLSQWFYSDVDGGWKGRTGFWFNIVSIVLWICSFVAFGYGIYLAKGGFQSFG